MAIDFFVIKPDGTRDKWEFMSAGSFGSIDYVAEQLELDMDEYKLIMMDRNKIGDFIIPPENVKKLLKFYQNMLMILMDLRAQGIFFLSPDHEIIYQKELHEGRVFSREKNDITPTLRQLIEICERAVEINGSILIIH